MGCGLSSQAATGHPAAPTDPPKEHHGGPHHHDEHHAHLTHNRPVRREPRPLNSRHPSPTGSRAGSQWLPHPESHHHNGSRRESSAGHQFLQVTDSSSGHHPNHQPLDLERLPLQLLQELNRQRRAAFGLTGEDQQLTLRDDACQVAKEAAKTVAEGARTDGCRPPYLADTSLQGYHVLARVLTEQEAHNLQLFLVNLMTEVKSKGEESSNSSKAAGASDSIFWTQVGQFGCAAVQFAKRQSGGSKGSVKKEDADGQESVAITMVFRPPSEQ